MNCAYAEFVPVWARGTSIRPILYLTVFVTIAGALAACAPPLESSSLDAAVASAQTTPTIYRSVNAGYSAQWPAAPEDWDKVNKRVTPSSAGAQ